MDTTSHEFVLRRWVENFQRGDYDPFPHNELFIIEKQNKCDNNKQIFHNRSFENVSFKNKILIKMHRCKFRIDKVTYSKP